MSMALVRTAIGGIARAMTDDADSAVNERLLAAYARIDALLLEHGLMNVTLVSNLGLAALRYLQVTLGACRDADARLKLEIIDGLAKFEETIPLIVEQEEKARR